jgi:hypothetical protein
VQEHFDAGIGPLSKAARKGRPRDDRGFVPMIGHHQHGKPLADARRQQIEKAVDLAFEARRNVVDRR